MYLTAFFELDAERSHALGLTPIPWTAVNQYASAYGFCGQQREDLFYFIRKMDNAHLAELDKNRPKK